MTRGSPAVNVIVVSGGGGPEVSTTIAPASGTLGGGAGSPEPAPLDERAPPQAAAARQSQLARPQSPRNIPAIDPLIVRGTR